MAPKKGQQTKQPQQQSQPPVVSSASARGAASPSVQPSSSTTPSEALVLVVASPACQWRSLGSSSLRPHQASMLSSTAARTQEEQLSALMVDSNRQHSARTLEQREEQKRTNDDDKVCEERNREGNGNIQKRGCISRYGLSRFGRSFLATQTFTRVEVQVTTCSTTKTKEISSEKRKTADLAENTCITTYVCAATNPFGGVKGLLPLVLLPESFIDQFCHDGRKELYLTIWGNTSSSSSPSSLSRQTSGSPKLLLNVLNVFDVPPSTAALSKFDGLVFVMAPPPSPKEKESYQRSAQCDISFRLEVTTVETARVDKESVSADTQANPSKASTVSSPHQQLPKVTLRLTANPMKPAMCAAISNADVSGVKVDATVQLVLKRENCAATYSAPMRAEDLFAVKAIASGIVSSSAETAVSSTSTAAVHPNKMGSGTNARSKQLTISDGGAKGRSASTSTCLLHPLIAKERVRAKLREAIEAAATATAYASPTTLTASSSAVHEPSSSLASVGVSASGEVPSIDLETITAMLNECIPDDVLGTSARSTITNVLSRVLMCCLQSERFNTLGLSLPKGVLLYDGPLPFGKYKPTGKTFMMSAMARTIENLRKYTDHHHRQNETFKPTVSGDSNEEVEKDKNSVAQQQQQRLSSNKKTHPSLATLLYTMVVDGHSCLTKEVGGTEKNIAKMLRDARVLGRNQAATLTASVDGQATSKFRHHGKEMERATTIIFLDNLEVLAPPRQDASSGPSGNSVTDRSLSTLLTELDGVRGTSPDMNNVILIATCRGSLASVDAAVRRPGRLDLHIELNPPQADVCAAAIAAPLLPVWQGIQLFREKQRRAKHQADSTVVEEDANNNSNSNNQEPSTAAQTQSIISVVDNNNVAVGCNKDKGFGFGTASSAVISLAHAEFLAAMGFGDLWLRLSGSDFVVPSSVADARYVSRQVLFSMVSRLTSQFPAVNFIPSAGESGSESTSALSDWVCRLCQAMDASTMDIGSTPSSFPLLSSCVDAADRMKAILKDEIARAMKSLSS